MRVRTRHKWNVTPREAREIQLELRKRWEGEDRLGKVRTVAGLDAAFVLKESQALRKPPWRAKGGGRWRLSREANRAIGGVVVYRLPEMEEVERTHAIVPLKFPYVPGLLSFREVPVLLAALKKLKRMPDLLFCDGHGYAHPRRFGLACHLGVMLHRPTIGCAKSILIGEHGVLSEKAGSWTELSDGGETIGAAVRTREGVKPVYVSQGHRVSLDMAIRMTLAVCDGTRIPKPTREADRYVREVKRSFLMGSGNRGREVRRQGGVAARNCD